MEFRNALSLLFSNIGYVFKILVWLLISVLITAAIGAAILVPVWHIFQNTTDAMVTGAAFLDTAKLVWSGTENFRVAIHTLVPQGLAFLGSLTQNVGATVGLAFTAVLLYIVYSFLMGMAYYVISDIINNLMASNLRFGFASNMALNFKKCCKYSFSRLVIALPIDIVCVALGVLLAYGLFKLVSIVVIPIILIVAVLVCTLRSMLFSGWLPRILYHPEERIYTAFTRSFPFVKSNFGGLFKAFGLIFCAVYLLASVFTVPTGGVLVLLLPSIYHFLLRAVELIGYYKTKGYRFYLDGSTVVNTVEYGFRKSNQEKAPKLENSDETSAQSGDAINSTSDDETPFEETNQEEPSIREEIPEDKETNQ